MQKANDDRELAVNIIDNVYKFIDDGHFLEFTTDIINVFETNICDNRLNIKDYMICGKDRTLIEEKVTELVDNASFLCNVDQMAACYEKILAGHGYHPVVINPEMKTELINGIKMVLSRWMLYAWEHSEELFT